MQPLVLSIFEPQLVDPSDIESTDAEGWLDETGGKCKRNRCSPIAPVCSCVATCVCTFLSAVFLVQMFIFQPVTDCSVSLGLASQHCVADNVCVCQIRTLRRPVLGPCACTLLAT